MTSAPLLAGACLLLASLNAAADPLPWSKVTPGSIKRVGAVSVVADKLSRAYGGVTILNDPQDEIDVRHWQLDTAYAEQLGNAAATVFGATYVATPYPYDAFANINQFNARGRANWDGIKDALKAYCEQNTLDGVVVAAKNVGTMPGTSIRRTPMGVQGAGYGGYLRLSVELFVYSCSGPSLIQESLLQHENRTSFVQKLPELEVSSDLMQIPAARWDTARLEKIHADLLTLPGSAWEETLRTITKRSEPKRAR